MLNVKNRNTTASSSVKQNLMQEDKIKKLVTEQNSTSPSLRNQDRKKR